MPETSDTRCGRAGCGAVRDHVEMTQSGTVMSLNVRLHDLGSAQLWYDSGVMADSLSVEQTPVALDTAELVVLPLLVEHLHMRARSSADLQPGRAGERTSKKK